MMSLLRVGPDGLILLEGLIVSAIVALVTWRRFGFPAAAAATAVAALAMVAWQSSAVDYTNSAHRLLGALFVLVPSSMLLGASRLGWLARRSWVLLVLGPFAFVGCYVGICVCAVRIVGI